MGNVINIEVAKSGFDVNVGGVDLFFSMEENRIMELFKNGAADLEVKTIDVQKKANTVSLEKMGSDNHEDFLSESEKALNVISEAVKIKYDTLFFDGAFDKLRAAGHSSIALDNAYQDVVGGIEKGIENYKVDTLKVANKKIDNYVKKSKKKKK